LPFFTILIPIFHLSSTLDVVNGSPALALARTPEPLARWGYLQF